MTKGISFSAGLAAGAIIGMVVGSVVDPLSDKRKKCMRKKSHHLFSALGNTLDSFAEMF